LSAISQHAQFLLLNAVPATPIQLYVSLPVSFLTTFLYHSWVFLCHATCYQIRDVLPEKLQQVLISIEDRSITLQVKKHKAPTGTVQG
jgi:hypothetical protein